MAGWRFARCGFVAQAFAPVFSEPTGWKAPCHAGRRGPRRWGEEAFDRFDELGEGRAPGRRVHGTRRNSAGTLVPASLVSPITKGAMKGTPSASRWVWSTASFHSGRKQPLARASVCREMTGTNRVRSLICFRIFAAQVSPPRSSFSSNQPSRPAL